MRDPQDFEAAWWGDCTITYGEEMKQFTYAARMGLRMVPNEGRFPSYDAHDRRILDIGGGPCSLLLHCVNRGPNCTVLDPCPYPQWTFDRYGAAGITVMREPAEAWADYDIDDDFRFDEAWIYNVLQHVEDPRLVVQTAMRCARAVRIFDWLDTPPHEGHPHTIRAEQLDAWLHASRPAYRVPHDMVGTGIDHEDMWGQGWIEDFRHRPENGCDWIAYYGVFPELPPTG